MVIVVLLYAGSYKESAKMPQDANNAVLVENHLHCYQMRQAPDIRPRIGPAVMYESLAFELLVFGDNSRWVHQPKN
jgi:hypothetical protein